MTLLKQNAAICIPLGTNALADWVVRGATTLHKLVALVMIFVVRDNRTTANFEPCKCTCTLNVFNDFKIIFVVFGYFV